MYTLRRGGLLALAVSLLLLTLNPVAADDKSEPKKEKPEQKALDAALRKGLYDVIDLGYRLHNDGDVPGGFRVFQGGLVTALPLLSHHPEIQKYIQEGLQAANRMTDYEKASFKLRAVIDGVREALKTGELPAEAKPLWVRLGGEDGVTKMVEDFIAVVAEDPKVNFTRDGKYTLDKTKMRTALVTQISSLTGGPLKYDKSMKAVHKDMKITDAEYTAAVSDLKKVLTFHKVSDDDMIELLEAVEAMRKDIVSAKEAPVAKTTDWEAMGGEPVVTKIVEDFVAAASKDPNVNFSRKGKYELTDDTLKKIKKELVKQISYLTNGPYQEEKGATPVYQGLVITEDELDAAAGHLAKALRDNKVPALVSSRLQNAIIDRKTKIIDGSKAGDAPKDPIKETLWERIGGDKGCGLIVDDFIAAAAKNAKANLDRGGTLKLDDPAIAEKLKKSLLAYLSAVAGGPVKYTEEIKAFDKSLKLTDAEFDARKEEMKKALEKHAVKAEDVKTVLEGVEKTRKDLVEAKKPDEKTECEVEGTVTVDDKPLAAGKIMFFGADKKVIEGEIKDGKYKVSGLKLGMYKVAIKAANDEIGAHYGLAETTPLKTEIIKEKDMLPPFPLKGKK